MDNKTNTNTTTKKHRENGSGCLIPPRLGITSFWTAQVIDQNGKLIRRSTKVRGELKADCDPKLTDSWTNITAAKEFLKKLVKDSDAGSIKVGADPNQLRYGAIRTFYLDHCRKQELKSLLTNSKGEQYVCGLTHLDDFFGYDESAAGKPWDKGVRVSAIADRVDEFINQRKKAGAANATINRSLAILISMFFLAVEKKKIQYTPVIHLLPEPPQPRGGFLDIDAYQRLYNVLGEPFVTKRNKVSHPYAYIQPFLQTGYFTGMRLGELLKLRWANVDLANGRINLFRGETKSGEPRSIPLIDGLPETFENLKRANPQAGANDLVFHNNGKTVKAFIHGWRKACVKAGIKTLINGEEVVSHFEGSKYIGLLFHDLRRSAARNFRRAHVPETVIMKICGWSTPKVFKRYAIVDERDVQDAATQAEEYFNKERKIAATAAPRNPGLRVVNG